MCKKTNILFFIESLQCGGAEKSIVSLLQLLDYNRYEVDLLLLNDDNTHAVFRKYVPEAVNVFRLQLKKNNTAARFNRLKYALKWRINRLFGIKRHNAEVLWPNIKDSLQDIDKQYDVAIAYQQGLPTYYIAEKIQAPKKIAWVNIDLQGAGYRESFNRKFYDKYSHIVAVSKQLHDRLEASAYVDKNRLLTIYDILNSDVIRQMSTEGTDIATSRGGAIKLVTVGRLSKQKNYLLAVETARVLRDKDIDFTWCFVGEGSERQAIQELIDTYNLGDRVWLAGLQSNPYPFINAADIYVHTAAFEGFGLTLAEARILGKPVVSTDFPIVFDQIQHGKNGLIATMNADDIASKVIQLINDTQLHDNIVNEIKKERNLTPITEVEKLNMIIGS